MCAALSQRPVQTPGRRRAQLGPVPAEAVLSYPTASPPSLCVCSLCARRAGESRVEAIIYSARVDNAVPAMIGAVHYSPLSTPAAVRLLAKHADAQPLPAQSMTQRSQQVVPHRSAFGAYFIKTKMGGEANALEGHEVVDPGLISWEDRVAGAARVARDVVAAELLGEAAARPARSPVGRWSRSGGVQ